jgi:hypothetical protein
MRPLGIIKPTRHRFKRLPVVYDALHRETVDFNNIHPRQIVHIESVTIQSRTVKKNKRIKDKYRRNGFSNKP